MSEGAVGAIVIGLIIGGTILIVVIKWAIHSAVNKGADAIQNAYNKHKEAKIPPSSERRKLVDDEDEE